MSSITEKDFPNLYIASDAASLAAQKAYLRFTRTELFLLISSSVLTVYSYESININHILNICVGILLLLSILIAIIVRNNDYERFWYEGRALAESVKTLSWRYIMKSESFENSDLDARKTLTERFSILQKDFVDLLPELDTSILALPVIPEIMEQVRSLSFDRRKDVYLKERILNQYDWYAKKAKFNRNRAKLFFYLLLVSETAAIISIIQNILLESPKYNFVGAFTTISAAVLAWVQFKKYSELNTAYSTTGIELMKIRDEISRVTNEKEFVTYVADAENAISREHTTWFARRR